jgi:hypothetical protein
MSENGILLYGVVEVCKVELAGMIEVEFGRVLEGEAGTGDRTLDKTKPVEASDVVERGDVGEPSHGTRDEVEREKVVVKRSEVSGDVFVLFYKGIFRLSQE